MSFVTPRTNIIAIMEDLNYVKEKDAFDFDNIGNTKIKKAFHIEQGTISAVTHSQQTVAFENSLTLRFWVKDKRDTTILMDELLADLLTILNNIMDESNRFDGVQGIFIDEFIATPHSDENDDIVRGELTLTINQELCFSIS